MAIDPATYISELDVNNPAVGSFAVEGADQITAVKGVLLSQFPNFTAEAVTFSSTELNDLDSQMTVTDASNVTITGTWDFDNNITLNTADLDLTGDAGNALKLSSSGLITNCQVRSTDADSGLYFSSSTNYAFARNGANFLSFDSNGMTAGTDLRFEGADLRFELAGDQIYFIQDGTLSNPNIRGTDANSGIRFSGKEVHLVRDGVEKLRHTNGGITVTGTGTATVDWTISSDIRLKENIEPIIGALDAILGMRGVHFDWKKSGAPQVGVIAQEVQKVIPTAVTEDEEGHLSVSTQQMVAVLIEAVRELVEKIDGNSQ